jgi:hypothetical protein
MLHNFFSERVNKGNKKKLIIQTTAFIYFLTFFKSGKMFERLHFCLKNVYKEHYFSWPVRKPQNLHFRGASCFVKLNVKIISSLTKIKIIQPLKFVSG